MEQSIAARRNGLARLVVGCLVCVAGLAWCPRSAPALPAGWGYELISPADPLGGDIDFGAGSPDGDHAWIATTIPITPDAHTGNLSSLAAVRTPTGWVLRDLADGSVPNNDSAQFFVRSTDSSRVIVQRCPKVLLACNQYVDFERVDSDGSRSLQLELTPFSSGQRTPVLAAASDDLATFVLQMDPDLTRLAAEDTHTQGLGLYASHNGETEFLGVDQNGNALDCGAALGNGRAGTGFEQNGLSSDGATVFYESPDPAAGCPGPVDLYGRRDGQSVNISAPRNGKPDRGATYLGNSRDGNVVYFLTRSQLVDSDIDTFADIYAYDVPSDALTRITSGADVSQAVVSPQGDYIYFQTSASMGGQGANGDFNLFVYHAGSIQLVRTATDGGFFSLGGPMNSPSASPLTPDGKHLLFSGTSALTGQPLGGTVQLFKYDLPTDSLTCISCPPDGSTPTGSIVLPIASPTGNADQREQSDDGRTVAFQTFSQLLPPDVNDVLDVYMWHDGVLSLISSGRSTRDSIVVSTDAAGHNVFFTTTDRLTPSVDQDNTKLYDARLGGGFPFNAPTPACSDDSCQPPLSDHPSYIPGGSETVTGTPDNAGHAGRPAIVTLAKLSSRALRRLLDSGRVTLKLHARMAGKIHMHITTTVHHHRVTLARATRTAHRAGTLRVRIRLERDALAALHSGATVRFAVVLAGHTASRTAKLPAR